MTEKRFQVTQDFEEHHRQIRDNGHIIMGCFVEPQAEVIVNLLNELNDENQKLKDKYERKDRQLQRAKKDTRKYTDYFMNELNWDCDRIIKEVFK